MKLHDPNWKACGKQVCLTPADAKNTVDNTVKAGKWMSKATTIIRYYEKQADGN